jgi:(2S)-methylsuccinyl-CoA dehydrogenase
MLACAYVADAVWDVSTRILGRETTWGVAAADLAPALPFVEAHRAPEFLDRLAEQCAKHGTGPSHLSDDFELVAETFRRFAEDKIRPVAEHVHRTNADVPEEIISGLAELGGFGLSVPEEYGGWATGGEQDYIGMVVATEELSRGSLGIGGSLVTRPEILTRALVAGGTEEQKQRWLPRIATGELMAGIMVTEPDFGSDVAGVNVTAVPVDGGWLVNGVKTWATFAGRADVLMLLARTDADRSGHRGLSVLIVEEAARRGHALQFEDGRGGKMGGRAIDTIGYRGMHSYEVARGLVRPRREPHRRGGRARPRLLPADGGLRERPPPDRARAVGLMQAAFEAAVVRAGTQGVRSTGVRLPAVA